MKKKNTAEKKHTCEVCHCSRRTFLDASTKAVLATAVTGGLLGSCNTVPENIVGDDESKLMTVDISTPYFDELLVVGGGCYIFQDGGLPPLIGYRLSEEEVVVVSSICSHGEFQIPNPEGTTLINDKGQLRCPAHMSEFDLNDDGEPVPGSVASRPLTVYGTLLQGNDLSIFSPSV